MRTLFSTSQAEQAYIRVKKTVDNIKYEVVNIDQDLSKLGGKDKELQHMFAQFLNAFTYEIDKRLKKVHDEDLRKPK